MRSDRVRPRRTWLGCVLLAAVALLTALVMAHRQPLTPYDEGIARSLHSYAASHPGTTHLMRVLTDWFWDPWTMRALAAAACLWLWRKGEGRCALRVGLVTLAASAVQLGLKVWVGRERPVWPDPVDSAQYAAYPSGHAMTATVVCGLLLCLVPRGSPGRFARFAPGLALLLAAVSVLGVGFTRLYLGVHWFSDVLAGWLLGAALVLLATADGVCSGRSPVSPRTDDPVR
ncbi:phosphatase PAP2 family protein [Streptomyces sp. ISL-43]|uniref:phosphatase PAP2 family protein n=1 Tax=Streptomyces sp. ISL-43 TaxID=2819183 RepID=UPI001BE69E48|nr:phosphatase PAP2 family protein [Streptomyces sp. ISL-43]MBT2451837.1 phosphatase PAP2 family protein [Streptomyces sp. ISL-43]